MREHWRDPGYWRWLWETRIIRGTVRDVILVAAVLVLAVGGFLSVRLLTGEDPPHAAEVTTAERLMTVVRTVDGNVETEVVTQTGTLIETGDMRLVTVVRDGKTAVVRMPGKMVTDTDTVRLPGKTNVVTNTRTNTETETQTQTNTVDRPVTTTERSTTTHTETRDVTGPERTVTDTETETQTETETETDTVTDTETVTETVTVTEKEKPPKP